jgi:signal transduction histidine kinase/GAF domain-containing protein
MADSGGTGPTAPDLYGSPLLEYGLIAIQPHGAVLVFDRPGFRLVQASQNLPRLLGRELHASLSLPVDALFDLETAGRIRGVTRGGEERRIISAQGRMLDLRIVAEADSTLVEIEPVDEHADATVLGAALDDGADALARAGNLADVARAAAAECAAISGFAVVALARILTGGQIQIVAEVNDGTLPPLAGRPDSARMLARLAVPGRLIVIADTAAPAIRLVAAPDCAHPSKALAACELVAPPPGDLAIAHMDGAVSVAVMPILCGGKPWGYLLLENGYSRRFGHDRRRFCRALAQITGYAVTRVQRSTRERAEQLAGKTVAAFEAAVESGTTALDALLFGDQLLAAVAGADGVAVLCEAECAVIGHAPDPDALLARLPSLFGDTDRISIDRLDELDGFSAGELAGSSGMLGVRLARTPFMALAAFRGARRVEGDMSTADSWDPLQLDALVALAAAFRRRLLLADAAAAAELSSQIEEFEGRAFGPGILRSTIMSSSASGMALLYGRGGSRLEIHEFNPMFRRLFGLDRRQSLAGTAAELGRRLGIAPELLVDAGQPSAELELWSSELGPRVVEIDARSMVRTRVGGGVQELTLLQVIDVTRIRRQEVAMRIARDQALSLIRARDELLANMSHELRTPLNAVIGFAEMISLQTFGPVGERYVGYGRDIETAGRHLLSLINDLLDLSRIASGRQIVEDAAVDLVELVESCVSWARAAARKRKVETVIDSGKAPLRIRGDERALRQVLINLISNAIKFTPDEGDVAVRISWRPHGAAVIEVIDNGIGMTPQEVGRAFDPFFRGGGAYRRRIEGAGLGLAIARGLMELHGGTLALSSIEGKGTTARIELPGWRVMPP